MIDYAQLIKYCNTATTARVAHVTRSPLPFVGSSSVTALHRGMILLADRYFAARDLITAVHNTGADLLIRVKAGSTLPVCRRLGNGSYVSRIGPL